MFWSIERNDCHLPDCLPLGCQSVLHVFCIPELMYMNKLKRNGLLAASGRLLGRVSGMSFGLISALAV